MILKIYELTDIKKELQKYKRNKQEVLFSCINERLNKSLITYYKTLSASFDYVSKQNEIKFLK